MFSTGIVAAAGGGRLVTETTMTAGFVDHYYGNNDVATQIGFPPISQGGSSISASLGSMTSQALDINGVTGGQIEVVQTGNMDDKFYFSMSGKAGDDYEQWISISITGTFFSLPQNETNPRTITYYRTAADTSNINEVGTRADFSWLLVNDPADQLVDNNQYTIVIT
jgi:hypothetical protein